MAKRVDHGGRRTVDRHLAHALRAERSMLVRVPAHHDVHRRRIQRCRNDVVRERCVRHPASYFLWLPLSEEVRADQVAMALVRERISVSTAEPFATSVHLPHAIRLALGSVELDALRDALEKVKRVIGDYSY